jgi:hypothetical protein
MKFAETPESTSARCASVVVWPKFMYAANLSRLLDLKMQRRLTYKYFSCSLYENPPKHSNHPPPHTQSPPPCRTGNPSDPDGAQLPTGSPLFPPPYPPLSLKDNSDGNAPYPRTPNISHPPVPFLANS